MEDPEVPMDTGSFNSSDGDINAVIDESHNVALVKNGSKFLFITRTTYILSHRLFVIQY